MPNTPVIVLHGVTIYCLGQNIHEEDKERVDDLLSSVGVGMEMPEHYMDIMTGLTGGGPSFVSHLKVSPLWDVPNLWLWLVSLAGNVNSVWATV